MVTVVGVVVAHWFGFTAQNIPESVQNSLLNIVIVGVDGYVAGRSAEKVVDKWKGPKWWSYLIDVRVLIPERITFTFQ
jgi:hypothetical protein